MCLPYAALCLFGLIMFGPVGFFGAVLICVLISVMQLASASKAPK